MYKVHLKKSFSFSSFDSPSVLKSPAYSVAKHARSTKMIDTLTDGGRTLEYSAELQTEIKTTRKTSH